MSDEPKAHPVPFAFEDRKFRNVGLSWTVIDNSGSTCAFRTVAELKKLLGDGSIGEGAAVSADGDHWHNLAALDDVTEFFWEVWQDAEARRTEFADPDESVRELPKASEDLWEDITMPSSLVPDVMKDAARREVTKLNPDDESTAVRSVPDPSAFDDEDVTVTRLSMGPPPNLGAKPQGAVDSFATTTTLPSVKTDTDTDVMAKPKNQLYLGIGIGFGAAATLIGIPVLLFTQGLIGQPVAAPAPATPMPIADAAPEVEVAPVAKASKLTEKGQTRDGVQLELDVYPTGGKASGVVLLHMIPPNWERSSWPADFIDGLHQRGWSVCVLDRRGAGESAGVAEEAYTGEKGRYDTEVCVKRLQADGLDKLAIIGASNGTTSMIDYAVWAESEGLPKPDVMGFMTGGGYTENNVAVEQLSATPAIFTFSTEEREWSVAQEQKSEVWNFSEYTYGAHGTKMFEAEPQVREDLYAALAKYL